MIAALGSTQCGGPVQADEAIEGAGKEDTLGPTVVGNWTLLTGGALAGPN